MDVAILYSTCPNCGVIGPPAWIVREGAGDDPINPPLLIGCLRCDQEYVVDDLAEIVPPDATIGCPSCRMSVPCPSTAHLVRCRADQSGQRRGCGDIIPGPC